MKINVVNIEDELFKDYLDCYGIIWIFNVFFFFLYGWSVGMYDRYGKEDFGFNVF